jgi:uncharacterized protein
MVKKRVMTSIVMLLSLTPHCLWAASFDCTKAATTTELLICANTGLSQMDELLQVLYNRTKKQTKAEPVLRSVQRAWIKERNQICGKGNVQSCETAYINGYEQLIHYYHDSLNPLSDGMLLPEEVNTGHSNYDMYDKIYLSYDMDQTWKQKTLLTLGNADVDRLLATVVDGIPYLVYLVRKPESEQTSPYEIHELNLSTAEDSLIAHGHHFYPGYGQNSDLFGLVDGVLYYPSFHRERPQQEDGFLYQYKIGSRRSPEAVGIETLGEKAFGLRSALYSVWPETKTIAMLADNRYLSKDISELAEFEDFFDTDPDKLLDYPQILVYSFDEISGYPLRFDQGGKGGWGIGSLVFDDTEPIIYFDNSGLVACIWTYNLDSEELMKIVPQHGAINPAPFKYKGNSYLAFSMVTYDDSTEKRKTVTISLASGDLYRQRW